ncbi:hypothetical protein EAS64_28495 [Trebonia kvetii]|uniref:Uncharacterized protein n=1 Tax=Trebonia kvetii TaxID=2480626 RepID=A0A6P2BUX1_9ACTN|nr:hypothetical protein [Trebonia kvetii]TVZ02698.1 hypothetical protein EAS64_28495 [Trebonia kvetii]
MVTALASGCASRSGSASGTGSAAGGGATAGSTATAKPGGNVPAFDKRAKLVAAAWDKAGLAKEWLTGLVLTIAPDELVIPGAKDFATGDQKMAFLDGRFALAGHLPTTPLTGKVRWPGGATATVPLLTAAQAYRKIATEQPCQGQPCPPSLVVTGAAPATVTIGTSRGKASVPAWTFTVPSIPSPITVAALAPGSYHTQPASLKGLTGDGLDGFTGAVLGTVSADGRQIHVLVGKSPCDTKSGALVYETSTSVVVGGWTYDPHPNAPCAAVLELESVPVELARPLGHRVVLSVSDGRPLAPGSFQS